MTFLNPLKIVENLDIRSGMKVADFGCGAGHFTIEIAKRVGKKGVVYAFDVQKEVLEALKSRISEHLVDNIEMRRVDLEAEQGTKLADELVDIVWISNVFFQAEDKNAMAKEAKRILKPDGKVVVIDWLESAAVGPLKESRVSKEEMTKLFNEAGFAFDREFNVGESHYGLIFRKS